MAKHMSVLDAPLLQLSPHDTYDVRAASSHLLVLGTTGSGKSSTTYKQAVISALKASSGGLFCIAKPEDAAAIRTYCSQAGRLDSLIDWDGHISGSTCWPMSWPALTPAIAFDSGFVGGYRKRTLPAGAPRMSALLPIAERCLGQQEADVDLCNAAGQMVGARAASGEIVAAR